MSSSTIRPRVLESSCGGSSIQRLTTGIPVQGNRNGSSLPPGYVEDHSRVPMLRFQDSLPRLPVPTLEQTAKRYLKSLHPILSASEYATSKAAIEDFIKPGGIGIKLQERLLARRNDPAIKNWIADWWREDSYLSFRDPLVPYVSYFYAYHDDSSRRDPSKRAAAIASAVLEFKNLVSTGALEPEYRKGLPLCMDCFTRLFNVTRIPARPSDVSAVFPADENKHIVVIRKNQFFKLPHEIDGKQLNTSELEKQFSRIYQSAKAVPAVGALTSENRDVWADARELLIKTSPRNQEALHTIDSASFVICLDDASPVTLEERARGFLHGNGTNRWYDKTLQFIINDNGTAGFMAEHSLMDGTPTQRLSDYINDLIINNRIDFWDPSIRPHLPAPELIPFEVTPPVQTEIDRALRHLQESVNQHQVVAESYQGYGKGLIKQFKCSPDAYVQMVMQLAYYKMHGKSQPTYESAATRRFQLGRTEACRVVTDESVAWCISMLDPSRDDDVRRQLFRKATDVHVRSLAAVADGQGVDRHFFGLKKLLRPDEGIPAVFEDPAFEHSSTWYMSTSQISSEFFNTYGWSQDHEKGFGVAYTINENSLHFLVVSKNLGSDRLKYYLQQSAGEVRDLMLPTLAAPEPKL